MTAPRYCPARAWWFEFDADQSGYCTGGNAHFRTLILFDDALRILETRLYIGSAPEVSA
jgi:hypothetical protein